MSDTELASQFLAAFLTVDEAAERLRIKRSTAFTRIKSGELASIKFGGRRLIPTAEILRLTALASASIASPAQ